MRLPRQEKPILRRASAAQFAKGGVVPQDTCSTLCGLLNSACKASPIPNSACSVINNCCLGACS